VSSEMRLQAGSAAGCFIGALSNPKTETHFSGSCASLNLAVP
jgi:hypothetical protein